MDTVACWHKGASEMRNEGQITRHFAAFKHLTETLEWNMSQSKRRIFPPKIPDPYRWNQFYFHRYLPVRFVYAFQVKKELLYDKNHTIYWKKVLCIKVAHNLLITKAGHSPHFCCTQKNIVMVCRIDNYHGFHQVSCI